MIATLNELKLHRLEIQNFMRVEALTVDAQGRHVLITGANGSGKTSTVDAIWWALQGPRSGVEEPVRGGAAKAVVTLDLGEIIVERKRTDNGSMSLLVRPREGAPFTKPQQLLDSLFDVAALDPITFQSLSPAEQVKELLQVVGIEPPVEEVQAITGENLPAGKEETALGYLERLAAEGFGLYYVRRRDLRRVLAQKEAAIKEQKKLVASLGGPGPVGQQEVSATKLLAQLEEYQGQMEKRRQAEDALAQLKKTKNEWSNLLAQLTQQARDTEEEIGRLQELLQETQARIKNGTAKVEGLETQLAMAQAEFDALPCPEQDIARLKGDLANLERINASRAKQVQATEQLDRLQGELASVRQEHGRTEDILVKLRDLRAGLLEGVNLGVSGLEVGEGELRLHGVPFKQAATSQRLRVGAAIAMLKKPALRLLRVDEGERLDDESLELLLQLASDNDFEVIVTQVRSGERLKVEILETEMAHA